ncbi:MAG: acyl-CoA thioesterase [Deltaproteobacteria bacterium]|nr:acyl-CoA thioesterase [Deltaproteobacteria bacterium]
MFRHERPVRFAEVDAARIVYFARYLDFCHDALEALFAALPGGYPQLIMVRGIGIPSVHIEADYKAPLRYGDTALIDVSVERIGARSVTFHHAISRAADGVSCASIRQVVVLCRLDELVPVDIPDDVRTLLSQHLPLP